MESTGEISGYKFRDEQNCCSHAYLVPALTGILDNHAAQFREKSCFDLGCGNGSMANLLSQQGWAVAGVDPSSDGIKIANAKFPGLKLEVGSAYEDLEAKYGQFPLLISLEVVEHVYSPRKYMKAAFDLVEGGGIAVFSTPYHGYLKNIALAVTGKMDKHFTALWDHGHIKFWSIETLGELAREAGFKDLEFHRVGRIPQLAKSMVMVAKK